ncbi:flavin reductase like domain-containing protein [Lipomyces orientalis]|uniref:Flavin reductase like domain-containing protein n=1 Tax=Lipomyces orientalis TaxID=1233043 RepID=A0ACC3TI38_9ASCO
MPLSSAASLASRLRPTVRRGAVQASSVKRRIHTLDDTPFSIFVSKYKTILSRHAAPLAVITAAHGPHTRAATVSSLTSLSVSEPGAPLVTFNLRVPSSTSKLIHESGRFSVNLLSGAHGAEQIARGFAAGGGAAHAHNPNQDDDRIEHIQEGDQVEILDVDWFPRAPEPYNTPMLNHTTIHGYDRQRDSPDASEVHHPVAFARLDCRTQRCFTVRDHEIWVGEVERIDFGKNLQEFASDASPPHEEISPGLVYFSRNFKRVLLESDQESDTVLLRKHQLRHRQT